MTESEFTQELLFAACLDDKYASSDSRILKQPRQTQKSQSVLKNQVWFAYRISDIAKSVLPKSCQNETDGIEKLLAAELTYDKVFPSAKKKFASFGSTFSYLCFLEDHPETSKFKTKTRKPNPANAETSFEEACKFLENALVSSINTVQIPSRPRGNDPIIAYTTDMATSLCVCAPRFFEYVKSGTDGNLESEETYAQAQYTNFKRCYQLVSLVINQYGEDAFHYAYAGSLPRRNEIRDVVTTVLAELADENTGEAIAEQERVDQLFNAYDALIHERARTMPSIPVVLDQSKPTRSSRKPKGKITIPPDIPPSLADVLVAYEDGKFITYKTRGVETTYSFESRSAWDTVLKLISECDEREGSALDPGWAGAFSGGKHKDGKTQRATVQFRTNCITRCGKGHWRLIRPS